MSEAISALAGVTASGLADIRELGLRGMISLRGDLTDASVKRAIKSVSGVAVPAQRRVLLAAERDADRGCAWMSPDEVMVFTPHDEADAATRQLGKALAKTHHLAVNLSDARAMFEISGPGAREVLAKLCPIDLSPEVFTPGMIRRTRAAQVPVAFMLREDEVFWLICFRSVARYVFDLLAQAAADGGEVGYFSR